MIYFRKNFFVFFASIIFSLFTISNFVIASDNPLITILKEEVQKSSPSTKSAPSIKKTARNYRY